MKSRWSERAAFERRFPSSGVEQSFGLSNRSHSYRPRQEAPVITGTTKTTLCAAAYAGYVLCGLLQIAATAGAFQHLTGQGRFVGWGGALLVGWLPGVGTALGIYGAHVEWQWSLPAASAVFIGIPALMLLLLIVSLWSTSADTDHAAPVSGPVRSDHRG